MIREIIREELQSMGISKPSPSVTQPSSMALRDIVREELTSFTGPAYVQPPPSSPPTYAQVAAAPPRNVNSTSPLPSFTPVAAAPPVHFRPIPPEPPSVHLSALSPGVPNALYYPPWRPSRPTCFYCGYRGHISRFCRKRQQDERRGYDMRERDFSRGDSYARSYSSGQQRSPSPPASTETRNTYRSSRRRSPSPFRRSSSPLRPASFTTDNRIAFLAVGYHGRLQLATNMAPSRAPDVYDRSRCLMTPLVIALVSLIFSSAASESDASFPVPKYLDYNETTAFLHDLASKHRSLASVYSIGKSVQGRELWVLKITTDPNVRSIGKPLFRYTANIHGNEALGRQLLLYLAEYMLENYGNDSRITRLVNNTELHFCPSLNPDGYANASEGDCEGASRDSGRFNSHTVDLNSNFPGTETDLTKMTVGREPETLAIMKWSVLNPFVLSASLHGGLVVVVYPYDYRSPDAPMDSPNLTPDDDVFRHLAGTYARKHSDMFRSPQCQEYFDGGITNGAEWIPVSGSMQDFSYIYTNCYEVTLEISCCKYPMANTLVSEWEKNKNALLSYMEQVHMGVKGVVKEFRTGKAIAKATVIVQGIDHNITTTERGEFWRLLLPGQYSLIVSSPGYESTVRRNITVMTGAATWVDVVLTPVPTTKPPKQYAPLDTDFVFTTKPEFKHHSQEELVAIFTNVTEKCPAITRLFSIGKSVEDRDLYFLEFSDNPGHHEPGEPEFKYVANIHGNEVIGREAVLLLAQLLCEQYGKSRRLTTLVNNTRIFLMASMNPDGYEKANVTTIAWWVRFNAHNVDLNRNFPDQYEPEKVHHHPREPETRAMMNFILARPIVLSGSLHGGALVANYPYDGNKEKVERIYSATPDDSLFRYLARTYARAHPTMSFGKPCPKGPMDDAFKDGITNGAAWYNVYGGMQDFNYLHSNSYELTIEMGCYKYPPASDLPKYWDEHKHALVTFMEKVHQGVKGFVKDEEGLPVPNATIHVLGIHHDVHSAVDGDFWRLLMPATYSVRAYVDGFPLPVQRVTVLEGNATWANFTVDRRYAKWSREHDFLIGENGEPKYLGADELANLLMQLRQNYSDIVEVKDSFGPPW
ncbi:hypothetical protein HPB51_009173 [Rhipicephalus microplus]|uniref:Zinc carboxypeptidase n=2 Tax=Rhipicephalus microplus TaxID=6941 RepID=A0A9J6F0G6_RHIMP|nr:hypothetical protein HPB51_009173 [Rhipicephalus microplus]